MIGWEDRLLTFICGAMAMMTVIGFESAIRSSSLDRWSKRFFVAFFGVLVACSACYLVVMASYAAPALVGLVTMGYYVYTGLCALSFPMLSCYLVHCCGQDWRQSPLFRAMAGLWCAFFVLLSVAQFSPSFFYIAPDNSVVTGPGYSLLMAIALAMLLLLVAGLRRRRGLMPRECHRALLICLIPVTLALAVHVVIPVFLLVDSCLVVSAFSMYRVIENASAERHLRQQREIAAQRARIAVLQMRPHFIYNAMTTIYYLCDEDPERAKQVTLDFTCYLRRNFGAIASDQTIPFAEELEHARAYLAVEQAQLEDDLVVAYDTPHVLFRVPPLTLQPIVENAVKHGADPDTAPLRVIVRTRETDAGSEVVVEDDGPGFDPAAAELPDTTLSNVRQRLGMMCGASLRIRPREGGGTVVTVTVPRRG